MQLSRFFALSEMTRSDTAIREGIPNDPDEAAISCLRQLCTEVLDPLRTAVGAAITVNSGYRGPALNKRIGGAANSQHVEGKATDIQCASMRTLELFQTVIRLKLPFDQLIYEARNASAKWVHVSHDANGNRGEIRVAQFDANGKPKAYPLVSAATALAMTEPAMAGRSRAPLEHVEMGDEPIARRPAKRKAKPARPRKVAKGAARPKARTKPAKGSARPGANRAKSATSARASRKTRVSKTR